MSNVERLESLYDQADGIKTVVMSATLAELCRQSQGGLTDSQIEYWCDRLHQAIESHRWEDVLNAA